MYSVAFCQLFNEPDIVRYIKINILGWAGHVIRMDNNRTVKKVFNTKPIGIRTMGGPKLRWEDDVIDDIKTLGVKNWRNLAMEKESWQKLLRKAVEPMMMMIAFYWIFLFLLFTSDFYVPYRCVTIVDACNIVWFSCQLRLLHFLSCVSNPLQSFPQLIKQERNLKANTFKGGCCSDTHRDNATKQFRGADH
jgi:hypothetical protein